MYSSARFCYGYGILIITLFTLLFVPACTQHSDDDQSSDTSSIKCVDTKPAANETGVTVNTPIRIVYDSPIERDDLILNFSMTTGSTLVEGVHSTRNDSVIFYPHEALKGRTLYKITITGFLDETPLETVSFEFTTLSTGGTICDGFYDPTFQLVSGMDNSAIQEVAVPGKGVELTDSAYQTCMVRMTDHINEPPEGFARAEYSRKQAFNANDTKLLALAFDGFWHLYDANSGHYLKRLNGPASDAEIRWDAADSDLLYYMDTYGGMAVYELNVETMVSRVVGSFEGRLPWTDASRVWTKSEGTCSADGRYWGMQVETSDFRPLGLMVWDQLTNEIVGTWDFAANGVGRPDHTSMSPSGEYIVASWDGNDLGTTAFSKDFQSRVKLHHKSEHSDLALLPNGSDAYVSVDYQSNAGEVFMVEIQTGVRTRLLDSYINGTATAFHFSGKAYHRPGWVLVSTYGGGPTKEWLHDKIFALALKENPEILNIAHHHSRANGYWTEPHATVNRDFTRIAFNSNWGKASETDVDIYQVKIPYGVIPSI